MFGLQGNNWIWILLAFFLLSGNDGCGLNFDLGNIFGCGNNTMLIVALGAIFLLNQGNLAC